MQRAASLAALTRAILGAATTPRNKLEAPVGDWNKIPLDSPLRRPPLERVDEPVLGRLDLLPFDRLSWEAFESLQLRIMLDVLGLRDAYQYGDPGQAQQGLDLVGTAANGEVVALQSKNYSRKGFGPAALRDAIKKFHDTKRSFVVHRLIIGVSKHIRSTQAISELRSLQGTFRPRGLEMWDARRLSEMLRRHPDIVVQYFSDETALRFCGDLGVAPPEIPTADARMLSDAITLSPERLTGAQRLLDSAGTEPDHAAALTLVEQAQEKLRAAGFAAYADLHESSRTSHLVALGRAAEAAREILDSAWRALDAGRTGSAQSTLGRLDNVKPTDTEDSYLVELRRVGTLAFDLYFNPLGSLPDPPALLAGDAIDRARLLLLAGETALAHHALDWMRSAVPVFASMSEDRELEDAVRVRLRLLIAEATDDWSVLLDDARRRQIPSALTPLIAARYARHCAIRERVAEAVERWEEAAALGALARQWEDAGTWMLSRRSYLGSWQPGHGNDRVTLEIALDDQSLPSPPVIPRAKGALEDANAALRSVDLRRASNSAQRALRDAAVAGDWSGERRARVLYAEAMRDSDSPERAAANMSRGGGTKEMKTLHEAFPNRYIDVVEMLQAENYWTVGTAYFLIALQADLVPDADVDRIAAAVLADLSAAETGSLRDVRMYATSRFNNAVKVLAGLSRRLSETDADAALAFFERQAPVEENHYRYHDDDEAMVVGGIARSHPALAPRAIRHLVPLMARAQGAQKESLISVLNLHPELSRPALRAVVGPGSVWAAEMLAFADPQTVDPSMAADAVKRLSTPLQHTPGMRTVGTNAVGDSLLVAHQPQAVLVQIIREMLSRAGDPLVEGFDRGDYLTAATNLALELDEEHKPPLFAGALQLSEASRDLDPVGLEAAFADPLGPIRIQGAGSDVRGRAMLLSSVLATTDHERAEVRRRAYAYLGSGSDAFPARALMYLGEGVKDDVAFLSGAGWAMRCLAATLWARYGGPSHIGARLASDDDVRVREALARSLAPHPERATDAEVRDILASDPSYRVRQALAATVDVNE
ncbi:hypothetical protein [Microbacterium sp. p3-SID336]|uniref:hypothetical protein n=1 Tax=Microbacterium sp. p3-SID336 TaxID=2916212 RepID=UPI0021A35B1C|nr:hypothetical protein [Microbacterium sp. p3-SID336]MCT1479376.1 hypothetical protein [Microbacterium sp. p3-SID336]